MRPTHTIETLLGSRSKLAVLRVLPNMTVIAPGDPVETRLAAAANVGERLPFGHAFNFHIADVDILQHPALGKAQKQAMSKSVFLRLAKRNTGL